MFTLPQGFMRIRHFGFLANRCRKTKLARIRACLASKETSDEPGQLELDSRQSEMGHSQAPICPHCKAGHLIAVTEIAPRRIEYG
ncbi:MAG: hypothetical protein AXA67_10175 [Methylothermaceae bacteria B42]|nr:MAG: hypothetical protein AXA67_10175 [Methylothermaceae bacteria B42]HHJ40398.1 hypothetical protein [Methylothermaceae bacterium]